MLNIELITDRVEVSCGLNKRKFSVINDYVYLLFIDSFDNNIIEQINQFKTLPITIIIISPSKDQPVKANNIVYIYTTKKWYIHTLFMNPFDIRCVKGYGQKAEELAKAFNQFTLMNILIVKDFQELQDILKSLEPAILIKTFDGIGDLLMLIPTIKTWHSKGYKVDVYIHEGRKDVLKNIPEVRYILTQPGLINLSKYYKFFDISFRLSDYNNDYCKKHRVFSTANLCGLKDEELISTKPEINLTKEEIIKGKELIGDYDTIICGESFDNKRTMPDNKIQELINILPLCSIVGTKNKEYRKVNNLTGKLSIRELFSCIYNSKQVITTDTSVLHIAAAFNKHTLFLPSTVNHNWRIYDNTEVILPTVKCYPCNENNSNCNKECLNLNNDILNKIGNLCTK